MGARASSQGLRALERPEFVGSVHAADGAECFIYNHVRLGFDESGEFVVVSGADVVVEIVDRHMDAACIELRPADALRLAALLLAQHENHDVGLRPLEHDHARSTDSTRIARGSAPTRSRRSTRGETID